MPIRTYIQDTQTLIPTPHSLQQNNCFICEHKNVLLGWFEAAAKTLRRLWHQPWCLQGMENTNYGAGTKWRGTEGYLPSISAQERKDINLCSPFSHLRKKTMRTFYHFFSCWAETKIFGATWHMAEESHGTGVIPIFLPAHAGGCWWSTEALKNYRAGKTGWEWDQVEYRNF